MDYAEEDEVIRIMQKNAKKESVERNCLKCSKKFKAESRFLRLCDRCKKHLPSVNDFGVLLDRRQRR